MAYGGHHKRHKIQTNAQHMKEHVATQLNTYNKWVKTRLRTIGRNNQDCKHNRNGMKLTNHLYEQFHCEIHSVFWKQLSTIIFEKPMNDTILHELFEKIDQCMYLLRFCVILLIAFINKVESLALFFYSKGSRTSVVHSLRSDGLLFAFTEKSGPRAI